MQDLEVIQRLNAESSAREIPSLLAAGKFVVATHTGLHYLQHEAYDSAEAAGEAVNAAKLTLGPSERLVLHFPSQELAAA